MSQQSLLFGYLPFHQRLIRLTLDPGFIAMLVSKVQYFIQAMRNARSSNDSSNVSVYFLDMPWSTRHVTVMKQEASPKYPYYLALPQRQNP